MYRPMLLIGCSLVVSTELLAQEARRTATVAEAIATVSQPAHGFGAMSPSEVQAYYRLRNLQNYDRGFYYHYTDADQTAWKSLLDDANASVYARMCAAFMLIDHDVAARKFLEQHLKSDNLRHRYNAAKVVETYVARDPTKTWGIDLLLEL